jgi:hypothetical protein
MEYIKNNRLIEFIQNINVLFIISTLCFCIYIIDIDDYRSNDIIINIIINIIYLLIILYFIWLPIIISNGYIVFIETNNDMRNKHINHLDFCEI